MQALLDNIQHLHDNFNSQSDHLKTQLYKLENGQDINLEAYHQNLLETDQVRRALRKHLRQMSSVEEIEPLSEWVKVVVQELEKRLLKDA